MSPEFERAVFLALQAFVKAIETKPIPTQQNQESKPNATSNGIPVCSKHGTSMKRGSEKQIKAGYCGKLGYKCTQKTGRTEDGKDLWCSETA